MPVIDDGAMAEEAILTAGRAAIRSSGKARKRIKALVPELARLAHERGLIRQTMAYEVLAVAQVRDGAIRFTNGAVLDAPSVCGRIGEVAELAVGIGTIGPALEATVTALFAEKQSMRAYVLNEIGNSALLSVSRQIRERLTRAHGTAERALSSPMFPGDAGFALGEQATLARLAEAGRIGVTTGLGGAINPTKSVSMVLGIGPGMPVWEQDAACARCRVRDVCRHRKAQAREAAP